MHNFLHLVRIVVPLKGARESRARSFTPNVLVKSEIFLFHRTITFDITILCIVIFYINILYIYIYIYIKYYIEKYSMQSFT